VTPSIIPTRTQIAFQNTEAEDTCRSTVASHKIAPTIFSEFEFQNLILDYLNLGGSPDNLAAHLTISSENPTPPIVQVVTQDGTRSGIPDIFLTVTLHQFDGYGDTHFYLFTCSNQQYLAHIVFRRAGAGSRAEGLYSGGGVRLESLEDVNADGQPDLFFSVNWPHYAEYFLVTWVNGDFQTLIEYEDNLGDRRTWLDAKPDDVYLADADQDGILEIVAVRTNTQTWVEETQVWRWDGTGYRYP